MTRPRVGQPPRTGRPVGTLSALAVAVVALGGCGAPARSDGGADGPLVVATTTILGDVVSDVLDGRGSVDVLMAGGQDPHTFSLSAADAGALRGADLVVANGLGLEASFEDALAAAEADGATILRVGERLDPLALGGAPAEAHDDGPDHDDEGGADTDASEVGAPDHATTDDAATDDGAADQGHGHEAEGVDPHVWLDPVRMADGARVIAEALATVDDSRDADAWRAAGERTATELEALHDELAETLASVPSRCRRLVTNHDALGYLAARYDLEVVGTVIPGGDTVVDPSARAFSELAALVRDQGIPAIFAETTASTRLAEALADEVGRPVEVVTLFTDSLGEPGSGADDYAGMLRTTAERIADALSGC